jgi:hypothetical protein
LLHTDYFYFIVIWEPSAKCFVKELLQGITQYSVYIHRITVRCVQKNKPVIFFPMNHYLDTLYTYINYVITFWMYKGDNEWWTTHFHDHFYLHWSGLPPKKKNIYIYTYICLFPVTSDFKKELVGRNFFFHFSKYFF